MTSVTVERVRRVFDAAIERDLGTRPAFLGQACAGDPALRRQVERLLDAHARAGRFLQGSALDGMAGPPFDEDGPPAEGRQIGAYEVVREIGRGGMGAVYLAERADAEFRKQVAIKLIKHGMDTDAVLRQFRTERQILASLEHPNIARLLDGGTTDDGSPYFVMEYIEGRPIHEYCRDRSLMLTDRLHLFRLVCSAVSYAHQRLVVHRDIKPSNILVGPDGVPKLLDFGIARILDPDLEGEVQPTATGLRLMTPEYASPEQAQGLPLTTLTDVYSLGVVLYELLAGRPPYQLTSRSPQEIAQVICTAEPERPSAALPRLRGDLDNIILKALRKEPARRYGSADELSQDILRYLRGLPVAARGDTFSYRAAKFVRRNVVATASAMLVALTLVGGIVSTSWEARRARHQEELARAAQARAERRFRDVRTMVRAAIFDYHDAIKDLPGSTALRERLVKDALQFLDSLAKEAAGDLSLQLELASAYERLGDVKGGTMSANLGDTAGAIAIYRKALQIREAVLAADPGAVQTRHDTALGYRKLGNMLLETGDLTGGLACNRKALSLFESLAAEDPGNADLRYEVGRSHDYVGLFLLQQGEARGALDSYRTYLGILEGLPAGNRQAEKIRRALSVAHERIGMALLELSDLDRALGENREALAVRAALAKEFPLNTDYRRNLGVSHYREGEILSRMGRPREALGAYRRYVAISEELSAADPRNEIFRQDLAHGLIRAGNALAALGDTRRALDSYRRGLALRAEEVRADPTHLWKRASLIEARAMISKTEARVGRRAAAFAACRETLSLMAATAVEPGNASIRGFFADTYADLGEAYATLAAGAIAAGDRRREWRTARDMYTRSLDTWRDLRERGRLSAIDAGKPAAISREVARCDAALGDRRPGGLSP